MGNPKQTTPVLKKTNKIAKYETQVKIKEVAELIAEKGYGRQACIKHIEEKWGVGRTQSDKYYHAAMAMLLPEDPEKYRETLIARNFAVLESMLQKALENNDLSSATQIVKIMNTMLNVGDKKVQVEQGDTKITVSFGE